MREIWFWQRIVSPHMAGLAAALPSRGYKVTYVAEEPMSNDRVQQGWSMPALPGVHLVYAATRQAVEQLIGSAPLTSVHICQGIRGNGLVSVAQRALVARGLRQWVVMETVDDADWRGALRRLEYRRLFMQKRRQVQGVLAIGHRTPGWVAARGVPPGQVFPFAYFLPAADLALVRSEREPGPFRFVFAGQLIPRKRVDWLIAALAGLARQPFELWIVGVGPEEPALRALASRGLAERVRWLGQLPLTAVPAVMGQADCLVLPSVHDGWGAVASEALMVGTPVICSDTCGAAGVVHASGYGGVFAGAEGTSLTLLLEQAVGRGPIAAADRQALAGWAECLGGQRGADYLLQILEHADGHMARPLPPWSQAARASSLRGHQMHDDIAVLHAIAGLHPRSGGTTRVVVDGADALARQPGLGITLLTQAVPGAEILASGCPQVKRVVAESQSRAALTLGLPFRRELGRVICTARPTLIHNHGLWVPLNHWATSLGRQSAIPVIVQPHGMLEPWALNHKALKKKIAMALFQRRELESAALFIATAAMEYESIRALDLRQPVAVIPNGVLLGSAPVPGYAVGAPVPHRPERLALFLSRVHPKKGILNLLNAWALAAPQGWRLQIAGPDEGLHLAEVMALARTLGIDHAVDYLGELAGEAKARAYLGADLFVLPTFSENFGVVVAEALAHGLPVITTRGAPWADLQTYGCGWWVDIGVDPLVHALREAMALSDDERRAMGARGRDYVRRYDWDDLARQTMDVYRWVLGQGPQPDCVRTD